MTMRDNFIGAEVVNVIAGHFNPNDPDTYIDTISIKRKDGNIFNLKIAECNKENCPTSITIVKAYCTISGQLFTDLNEAIRVNRREALDRYLTLNYGLCSDCIDIIVNNIDTLIEKLIEFEFVDPKSEEK